MPRFYLVDPGQQIILFSWERLAINARRFSLY